ncbi:radical SAM protein [Candidatus Methylacidiphilum infernorum]|uniref:Radical SAM protein n=1 Tax=Candidatus Methylacidiphilum infernorum TaxID=511746 RepID=A0ABX7PTS3_9BACT|nr:radical SAM protein [Candidatus Methylacidiphilum infernorum]QSR86391.1 radical SAM protein [Candidatus Methylacidiphilum infernorum]
MIHYSVLGIMLRKKCPLRCAHCITDSSPGAEGELDESFVFSLLEEAVGYTPVISFTGGEAFVDPEKLTRCVAKAKSLGLKATAVTGCGWVRSEKQAFEVVEKVHAAGLDRLCISWDRYHAVFKNEWKLKAVARTASRLGLPLVIRSVISPNKLEPDIPELGEIAYRLEKIPLIKLGRAELLPEEDFFWTDSPPSGTCGVVLAPVVEYDGRVFACCGPSHFAPRHSPLFLGDAKKRALGEILKEGREDPILETIALAGSYGLYKILKDYFPAVSVPERKRYSSICDICLDILKDEELIAKLRSFFSSLEGKALLTAMRMMRKYQDKRKAQEKDGEESCCATPRTRREVVYGRS